MSIVLGGWLPDPKNITYDKWTAPLGYFTKNSVIELPVYTPISDQKQRPSCVGNAVADMFEIMYGMRYGKENVKQFSRRFVWTNARSYIDKVRNENSGCHIKDAMYSISKAGICLESTFPYEVSDDECRKWPTIEAYKEADSNRITEYYKIDHNEDISYAITSGLPVVTGINVGRDFLDFNGGSIFDRETRPEGGHAVLLVGYDSDNDAFKLRNSWGEDWGENGYAWVSGSWIRSSASDSWVATGVKKFV